MQRWQNAALTATITSLFWGVALWSLRVSVTTKSVENTSPPPAPIFTMSADAPPIPVFEVKDRPIEIARITPPSPVFMQPVAEPAPAPVTVAPPPVTKPKVPEARPQVPTQKNYYQPRRFRRWRR